MNGAVACRRFPTCAHPSLTHHRVLGVALPWLHALLAADADAQEANEGEVTLLMQRGCAALIAATRDDRVRQSF